MLGLAVEEMSINVMKHGFNYGKKHHIELRVIRKKIGWIMRMRDECRRYDPTMEASDDPVANYGIKMLKAVSADIRYLGTLDLNNILIIR